MYQQPNHSYSSADSFGRRMSSNNPFRKLSNPNSEFEQNNPRYTNVNGTNLVKSTNTKNFDNWVQKNKKLLDDDDNDDSNYNNYLLLNDEFSKPEYPSKPFRSNSDSTGYVFFFIFKINVCPLKANISYRGCV